MTETESITVAGHKIEWGKLDVIKCSNAYMGGSREYNPFLPKDVDLDKIGESYHGMKTGLGNWTGYGSVFGHNPPLEGARGCMRECYAHLEQRGVLKRDFHNKFRDGSKAWAITDAWRAKYAAEIKGTLDNEE